VGRLQNAEGADYAPEAVARLHREMRNPDSVDR